MCGLVGEWAILYSAGAVASARLSGSIRLATLRATDFFPLPCLSLISPTR